MRWLGIRVCVWSMATHKPKGKKNKDATNPARKQLGESGVEAFISKTKMYDNDEVSKMLMLEPREWLDYACVGVAEEANGTYRAVYDLNILEYVYALSFAYDEFKYKSFDKLIVTMSPEHVDMAEEWVSYNTVRGAGYMGPTAPLFVRSHAGDDWQTREKWGN